MKIIVITNDKKRAKELYPDVDLIVEKLAKIIDKIYPATDIITYWNSDMRPMSPELENFLEVFKRQKQMFEGQEEI